MINEEKMSLTSSLPQPSTAAVSGGVACAAELGAACASEAIGWGGVAAAVLTAGPLGLGWAPGHKVFELGVRV